MRTKYILICWVLSPGLLFGQSQSALREWKGLYAEAEKAYDLKDYKRARIFIDSFLTLQLERNILVVRGNILSAKVYMEEGDYSESENLLDSISQSTTTLASRSLEFSNQLILEAQGELFDRIGRYDDAIDAYDDAIDYITDENEEARILLWEADVYLKLEEYFDVSDNVENAYELMTFENKSEIVAPYLKVLEEKGYPLKLEEELDDSFIKNDREDDQETMFIILSILVVLFIIGMTLREQILIKLEKYGVIKTKNLQSINKEESDDELDSPNTQKSTKTSTKEKNLSKEEYIKLLEDQGKKVYKFREGKVKVQGDKMIYIANSTNTGYPEINLVNEEEIDLGQRPSLKKISETIVFAPLFYRASRKYILNVTHIDPDRAFEDKEDYTTYMKNGHKIVLPESRWPHFETFYRNHLALVGTPELKKSSSAEENR